MTDRESLEKFNKIYDETYSRVLKFVVCKCSDMEDVNDILQEIYIDVYKNILKNKKQIISYSYVMGIAKNKIKKHYSLLYRLRTVSFIGTKEDDMDILEKVPDCTDPESIVLNRCDMEEIGNYLKTKSLNIQKIFYLYYGQDLTIKQTAYALHFNESYVKNCICRTIKELKAKFGKEHNRYDR